MWNILGFVEKKILGGKVATSTPNVSHSEFGDSDGVVVGQRSLDLSQSNEEGIEESLSSSVLSELDGFELVGNNQKDIGSNKKCSYAPCVVTKEECPNLMKDWLHSDVCFLPSDFDSGLRLQPAQLIYVPFKMYKLETKTPYSVEVRIKSFGFLNQDEPVNVWTVIHGEISYSFEEVLQVVTRSINAELLNKLLYKENRSCRQTTVPFAPIYSHLSKDFSPNQIPDDLLKSRLLPIEFEKKEAWSLVQSKIEALIDEAINAQIYASRYNHFPTLVGKLQIETRNLSRNVEYLEKQSSILYLPIFLSDFQYGTDQAQLQFYEVMISGATERKTVEGYRPIGTGMLGKFCRDALTNVSDFVSDKIGYSNATVPPSH